VLTSYLVANAIILPMSAWLSRVFGRKRYYMMNVALVTATSFLCGIAPSLSMLILFRVLQGLGGGSLAPVEQAILVDTFPKEKLGGAFALYSMAMVTAPAIGPPLGGWITDNFSWRWVFFITFRLDSCRSCFRAAWCTTRSNSPRSASRPGAAVVFALTTSESC
jgi:DHA2 family multidrug resistance protein